MTDEKDEKEEKEDYIEIEFELGDLEFEAKGTPAIVERMFQLLLDKIDEFKIEVSKEEEVEEEEEEEVEEEVEEDEEVEAGEPPEDEPEEDEAETDLFEADPPPEWDSLDESPPEVTDIEREAFKDE